jgi:uncharacterized protein YukE
LRAEDWEQEPAVFVEIRDEAGNVMQRLDGPAKKGLHRISWNLRFPNPALVDMKPKGDNPWDQDPVGPLVLAGTYTATLYKRHGGELTELGTQSFYVKRLEHSPEHTRTPDQVLAFQKQTVQLSQSVNAAEKVFDDYDKRVAYLRKSFARTTADVEPLQQRLDTIQSRMNTLKVKLSGDSSVTSRNEAAAWSVKQRVNRLFWHWNSQFDVPGTYRRSMEIAKREFEPVRGELESLGTTLDTLESDADALGVPWTPGRNIR